MLVTNQLTLCMLSLLIYLQVPVQKCLGEHVQICWARLAVVDVSGKITNQTTSCSNRKTVAMWRSGAMEHGWTMLACVQTLVETMLEHLRGCYVAWWARYAAEGHIQ